MPIIVIHVIITLAMWYFTFEGLNDKTIFPWWVFLVFALWGTWKFVRALYLARGQGVAKFVEYLTG